MGLARDDRSLAEEYANQGVIQEEPMGAPPFLQGPNQGALPGEQVINWDSTNGKRTGRETLKHLMKLAQSKARDAEYLLNEAAGLREALSVLDNMLPKEMASHQEQALRTLLERINL